MRKLLQNKFLINNKGVILFLLCTFCFRTAIADWNPVPSSSMEPTIFPGDVILVNKTLLGPAIPFTESRLFDLAEPQRGDIITFQAPHEDATYIKRVIGLPGDRIRTEGLNVYVNGEVLPLKIMESASDEDVLLALETINGIEHAIKVNLQHGIRQVEAEIIVPPSAYFVMGDYRNNSEDSRFFGFVPEHSIIGKATRVAVSIAAERNFLSSIGSVLN